jgi:hypothetical protein
MAADKNLNLDMWIGKITINGPKTPMTIFADKTPKVKKARTTAENNDREAARFCLVNVIDSLMRCPENAAKIWNYMEANGLTAAKAKSDAGTPTKASNTEICGTTFGKLKPRVKAWVYLHMSKNITEALLDAINDKDPLAIDDMFTMHFQISGGDRVPSLASDPEVMLGALQLRGKMVASIGDHIRFSISVGIRAP